MTTAEGIVIVGGLVLGYWLVGVLLPHLKRDRARPGPMGQDGPGRDPPDHDGGQRPGRGGTGDRNWHEVLEVAPTAGREQVIHAYKRKIVQYHPDKVATMAPEIRRLAEARSIEINVAYDRALYSLHERGL